MMFFRGDLIIMFKFHAIIIIVEGERIINFLAFESDVDKRED